MGVSKKKVISAVLTMAMVAPMVLGVPLTARAAKADADEDPTNKKFVTDVYAYGNDVVVNEPTPGSTVIQVGTETYYGKSGEVNIYLGAKAGEKVKAEGVSITVNGGSVKDIILSGQGGNAGKTNDGAVVTNAKVTVLGGSVKTIKTQSPNFEDENTSTVAEVKLLGGLSGVTSFNAPAGKLTAASKCTVAYYGNAVDNGSGAGGGTIEDFPAGSTDQVICKLAKLVLRPGTNGQIGTSTKAIVTDMAVEVNDVPIRLDDQMDRGFTSKDILAIPTNSDEGKEFMDYVALDKDGANKGVLKLTGSQSDMSGKVIKYEAGMSNAPTVLGSDGKPANWKDTADGLAKAAKTDPNAALKGYDCVILEATYKDAAFSRVAGSDRVQTSLEVAKKMSEIKDGKFDDVILACANNFPDALSASTLSAVVVENTPDSAAPIILVNSANEMNVALAVNDLWDSTGDGKIYLIGGEAVLPNSVVDALNKVIKDTVTGGLYDKDTNEDGRIKRLAGADRYATNVAVLEEAKALTKTGGTYPLPDFFNGIILASGENYPDALAASAGLFPIVLTRGTAVPEGTVEFIQSVNCNRATIVGGTGVVGTAVETWAMNEFGRPAVRHFAGVDRFETAAKIADENPTNIAVLAYGFDYPDALAAGPLAQMTGASILLVTDQNKDAAVSVGNEYDVNEGYVLGGPTLISGTTAAEIIKDR